MKFAGGRLVNVQICGEQVMHGIFGLALEFQAARNARGAAIFQSALGIEVLPMPGLHRSPPGSREAPTTGARAAGSDGCAIGRDRSVRRLEAGARRVVRNSASKIVWF